MKKKKKAIKAKTALVHIKHVFNTSINHRKDTISADPTSTYNWLPLSFKDPRRNRSNVSASFFSFSFFFFLFKKITPYGWVERERSSLGRRLSEGNLGSLRNSAA